MFYKKESPSAVCYSATEFRSVYNYFLNTILLSVVVEEFAAIATHGLARCNNYSIHYALRCILTCAVDIAETVYEEPWVTHLEDHKVNRVQFVLAASRLYRGILMGMGVFLSRVEWCLLGRGRGSLCLVAADRRLEIETAQAVTSMLVRDAVLLTWFFVIGGRRMRRFIPRAMVLLGAYYMSIWIVRPFYMRLAPWTVPAQAPNAGRNPTQPN